MHLHNIYSVATWKWKINVFVFLLTTLTSSHHQQEPADFIVCDSWWHLYFVRLIWFCLFPVFPLNHPKWRNECLRERGAQVGRVLITSCELVSCGSTLIWKSSYFCCFINRQVKCTKGVNFNFVGFIRNKYTDWLKSLGKVRNYDMTKISTSWIMKCH